MISMSGRLYITLITVKYRNRETDPHSKVIIDKITGTVISPFKGYFGKSQRLLKFKVRLRSTDIGTGPVLNRDVQSYVPSSPHKRVVTSPAVSTYFHPVAVQDAHQQEGSEEVNSPRAATS